MWLEIDMNYHGSVICTHIWNIWSTVKTEVLLKHHFKSEHLVLRVIRFPDAKHGVAIAVPSN